MTHPKERDEVGTRHAYITTAPTIRLKEESMTKASQEAEREFLTREVEDLTEILAERHATPIVITKARFKRFEPIFRKPPEGLSKSKLAEYHQSLEHLTDEWRKILNGDVYAFVRVVNSETDPTVYLDITPHPHQLMSIAATKKNSEVLDSAYKDRMSSIPKHASSAYGKIMTLFKYAQMDDDNIKRLHSLKSTVTTCTERFLKTKYGNKDFRTQGPLESHTTTPVVTSPSKPLSLATAQEDFG